MTEVKFISSPIINKVEFINSPNIKKKLRALFYDNNELVKKVDFGASGYGDYTIHNDLQRKHRYIIRHQKNEDWDNPYTAGTLSRYILWNKPTLEASIKDYKKRFIFK